MLQLGDVDWREEPGGLFPYVNNKRVEWAPQPGSQVDALECPTVEALIEGNRGPGKTDTLLMDFARGVGRGWGADWRGILFRRTYPELRDVIAKSQRWFRVIFPDAKFVRNPPPYWEFPGGEVLFFSQFEKDDDYWKYHGHAYPWIGWEELCNWNTDGPFRSMFSCLRSTRVGMPRRVRATTNPYGPGHNWVKARYQLPIAPGKRVGPLIRTPGMPDRRAIHCHLSENRILLTAQPDYIDNIRAAARNPAELAAWIDGSWDIVSGGMFDDIWSAHRDRIVVDPFPVPESWRIDRALDWGSSKPSSVGWWAESDGTDYRGADGRWRSTVRGDLFLLRELYTWNGRPNEGNRMLASELARDIVEVELAAGWRSADGSTSRVRRGVADSSIFNEENDMCVARDLQARVRLESSPVQHRGPTFDPADKRPGSRKAGWSAVRERMAAVVPRRGAGVREAPGLFVFPGNIHWLRTVPVLPRDGRDPDDVDTEAEDHTGDMTRYRVARSKRVARSGRIETGAYGGVGGLE